MTSPDYEQTLGALYREASAVVPDDDAMVLVRKADEPLMRRLVGGAASVEGSLTCLGGVDIEAPDGRGVRNTLDSRLARSEPELRHLAVQMIPELARIGAEP